MAAGRSNHHAGPLVRAIDPWGHSDPSTGGFRQLLSEEQRSRLNTIATIVRFRKGETIYSHGEAVKMIYNVIDGVVKACKIGPGGAKHIVSFLYPGDIIGLSEEGRYVNSASALTPVTAYSLPLSALLRSLPRDGELEFQVIAKLCHELRENQRHALLLAQQPALARLAMFLRLQEHIQSAAGRPAGEIDLPMSRTDIADFVGLSLAAVSRGFRSLLSCGIVSIKNRRDVKIVDRKAFEALAGNVELL